MKKEYWIIAAIFVVFIPIFVGLGQGFRQAKVRDAALYTYIGVVSATSVESGFVFNSGKRTYVFFENQPKITLNGDISLTIGREYSIVADGAGNLLSISTR